MKRLLLLSALALGGLEIQAQTDGCIELFISEYVEGWSNNKAIEIYNPTAQAKDLSNYRLDRYSNGDLGADANQRLILSGSVDPYSTFVIVIDKRDEEGEGQEAPVWDELQAKADVFECPVYATNNAMYFNGNDAMVLRNISSGGNGFIVDVIGEIGENPDDDSAENGIGGWNNVPPSYTSLGDADGSWTTDHSLIRKFGVTIGDLNGIDEFDVSVQWDSIPPVIVNDLGFLEGNWSSLGVHECACNPLSVKEAAKVNAVLYPNPAERGEELTFKADIELSGYEIFDITGKIVKKAVVGTTDRFTISLSDLHTGIYIFKAFDKSNSYTQKLVIR